jgi:hypothetical protein
MGSKEKNIFVHIREYIEKAPALMSPNFDKDFILYTFSSETSYVTILTQKNHEEMKSQLHL